MAATRDIIRNLAVDPGHKKRRGHEASGKELIIFEGSRPNLTRAWVVSARWNLTICRLNCNMSQCSL